MQNKSTGVLFYLIVFVAVLLLGALFNRKAKNKNSKKPNFPLTNRRFFSNMNIEIIAKERKLWFII